MNPYLFALLALCLSIIVVAIAIRRTRRREAAGAGVVARVVRFVGGPFPLSVAIHVGALLFLIITVHESRGRDLILVNLEAGGGGGGGDEMQKLDLPEVPMPDLAPRQTEMPQTDDTAQAVALATDYVRSEGGGIGLNRGGDGVGIGHGPGFGGGWGGFIGHLRRNGLDVVLVIDGTDSMRLVMADVKARMKELVRAIQRLVPTARIGIVVYGGEGEPLDVQPLTLSPAKLDAFLSAIQTKGGGEWEENTYGAMQAAVDRMDWKPYARKVIVLAGDAPPKPDKFAAILELERKFRAENGFVSVVDPTAQEHQRFERAFNISVHREATTAAAPMPAFYQQARSAFAVIAHTGGGELRSLDGDAAINQQVLIMAFGSKWQEQLAAYER
ncbi:MAG TPA: vWA domain-containing protein [Candidatus Binataceae bacterium]|nr:vWA domain-containing protein [Candidatus Binataceae bacterium]